MYCTRCGNGIPENSNVCPYCGHRQMGRVVDSRYQYRTTVNNIFSALIYEKTRGAIMEFVLWCIVCVDVLLSLIASIMSNGDITWILLMIFSIGLAVIMAFRLKPIAMLYGAVAFLLIINTVHFVSFYNLSKIYDSYYTYDYFAVNVILFVLEILIAIGTVICAFIQFFSPIRLGNAVTTLVVTNMSVAMLRQIMMYAVPYIGTDAVYINELARSTLNYRSYWFGTVCLWIVLITITLLYIFFFWGDIDSRKEKIPSALNGIVNTNVEQNSRRIQKQVSVGLRGITGVYAGQTILLEGRTITIGSNKQMMLVIPSPYVSGQHCAIRFNSQNGYYEIFDNSKNGVRLKSGAILPKGVYTPVRRGQVISIGNDDQQFILL